MNNLGRADGTQPRLGALQWVGPALVSLALKVNALSMTLCTMRPVALKR